MKFLTRLSGAFFVGVLAFSFTASTALAQQQTVWWEFCDSCSTEQQFSQQAYDAPTGYEWIYVSNRDSNESKKYQRFTTREDFGNGYVWMTHVVPATMQSGEKNALENAISGANITEVTFDRGDLAGTVIGFGDTSSVMGDFSGRALDPLYTNALIRHLESSGALPTLESVNQALQAFGVGAESGGTIRARNLIIEIVYDDGSAIVVRLKPNGDLDNWVAVDVDGQSIDLDIDQGGDVVIDDGSLGSDFSIFYGGDGDQSVTDGVNSFILAFDRRDVSCRTIVHGPQRIEVRCRVY